jgi:hypothetical protein
VVLRSVAIQDAEAVLGRLLNARRAVVQFFITRVSDLGQLLAYLNIDPANIVY